MVKKQSVEDFINYNFKPFSRAQCIKRMIFIFLSGTAMCALGKDAIAAKVICGVTCAATVILFINLLSKHNEEKSLRFLCDGTFWSCIILLLFSAAYRLLSYNLGEGPFLFICLFIILAAFCVVTVLMIYANIKSERYSGNSSDKSSHTVLPFAFGALGVLCARIFLPDRGTNSSLTIVAIGLLILAFPIAIGGIGNLLKVFLEKKYKTNEAQR